MAKLLTILALTLSFFMTSGCESPTDGCGLAPDELCDGLGSGLCDAFRRCGYIVDGGCEDIFSGQVDCPSWDEELVCDDGVFNSTAAMECVVSIDSMSCEELAMWADPINDGPIDVDNLLVDAPTAACLTENICG